jgi:hypothetical protein
VRIMPRAARTVIFAAMVVAGAMASAPVTANASSQGATAAQATGTNFCTPGVEDVPVDCLNDWGNGLPGTTIRLDGLGDINQNFSEQVITGRCGGTVTSNCPFNGTEGSYFDKQYHGFPIVQLVYGGSTHCVSTYGPNSSGVSAGTAVLGTCINVTSGTGGSNGAAFVDHNGYMINVYWTNQDNFGNNASCMQPQPVDGTGLSVTMNLNFPTGEGCSTWRAFPTG